MKKSSKSKLHVLEGAMMGAALGVAAGLLLSPGSGKANRKKLEQKSAEFFKKLMPELKKLGKMTEKDYRAVVAKAAAGYRKAKKLSQPEMNELVKEAHKYWSVVKKHF